MSLLQHLLQPLIRSHIALLTVLNLRSYSGYITFIGFLIDAKFEPHSHTYRCLCAIIVSEPKAWVVWVFVIARTCDACKTDNAKGHWTVNWSGHVYTFTYLPTMPCNSRWRTGVCASETGDIDYTWNAILASITHTSWLTLNKRALLRHCKAPLAKKMEQ